MCELWWMVNRMSSHVTDVLVFKLLNSCFLGGASVIMSSSFFLLVFLVSAVFPSFCFPCLLSYPVCYHVFMPCFSFTSSFVTVYPAPNALPVCNWIHLCLVPQPNPNPAIIFRRVRAKCWVSNTIKAAKDAWQDRWFLSEVLTLMVSA